MLYVVINVGLLEDGVYYMPYEFLDPGKSGAAGTYVGLLIFMLLVFVAMWTLSGARDRARKAPKTDGWSGYCSLFWCGPPSMCAFTPFGKKTSRTAGSAVGSGNGGSGSGGAGESGSGTHQRELTTVKVTAV
jgi:hypothetical protein